MLSDPSLQSVRTRPSHFGTLRILGALAIFATAGCTNSRSRWSTPVRAVAYNPYVSSASVYYDPQGQTGVAYRPPDGVGYRTRTVTREEYKEVVRIER